MARLRDAKFFWDTDRKVSLESRVDRLGTLLFHRKLGNYKQKAERIERLLRSRSIWVTAACVPSRVALLTVIRE